MTQLFPRTFVLSLLLVGSLFLVLSTQAQAERLESDSYVVQFGNFNMGSGEQDSTSFSMTQTLGQIGAGPYQSATKFLGAGFQYIYTIHYFRFAISKLFIDLGELLPGAHNSDSNVLTIDTKGAGGYIVYVYETHPLRHSDNVTVLPDTTCDAGSCTQVTAQPWTNTLVPGFGFNVSGAQVAADFLSPDHFRQFADNSLGEPMQPIMSSPYVAFQNQATVTYKAGATGAEAAGNYRTEVVYIAVPGY